MPEVAATISNELKSALEADELELPSLPEVALRIRDEAESQRVSADTLAQEIAADAGLAANLIRIANSAMFRGTRAIDELPTAINRMGLEYAANLATGLAMRQMFQATSDLVDRKLRATWSNAAQVASISSAIARKCRGLRVDQAMLAGLTHSIGVLPILAWAEENDDLLADSLTLQRVIDSIHGSIGTMILQRWDFPPELALVPSHYQDFERHSDTPDYISIVTIAAVEAAKRRSDADVPDRAAVAAYGSLEIPGPELDAIVEEALASAETMT